MFSWFKWSKLIDPLTRLAVSQFISFGFYTAAFAIAVGKYESAGGLGAVHLNLEFWKYIIPYVIVMLNAVRFYLANWEVEEDQHFRTMTQQRQGWMHFEWILRAACLIAVYVAPITLTKGGAQIEFVLISMFAFITVWDFLVAYKLKKAGKTLKTWLSVLASSIGRGKSWRLKEFEDKVVLWRGIELLGLTFSIVYTIGAFRISSIGRDGFSVLLGALASVYAVCFIIEFLANLKDYFFRSVWCFLIGVACHWLVPFFGKV